MSLLQLANDYALKSVDESCSAVSRYRNRRRYQRIAERTFDTPEHQSKISRYLAGERDLNTYVFPYVDPEFAGWMRATDVKNPFQPIRDASSCIIRTATSYCAYKIREVTDAWPKSSSREVGSWIDFLFRAGYPELMDDGIVPNPLSFYVGIPKQAGDDCVVWFEGCLDEAAYRVNVSTYSDEKHVFATRNWNDYFWVNIPMSDNVWSLLAQPSRARPPGLILSPAF